jgi:hypothetical protein
MDLALKSFVKTRGTSALPLSLRIFYNKSIDTKGIFSVLDE